MAASGIGATLMWLNLRSFGGVLDAGASRRMAGGAAALTACSVILLVIAIVHISLRHRRARASALMLGLTVVASLALPLTARGPGRARQPLPRWQRVAAEADPSSDEGAGISVPRVTIILLDGGSLDIIRPAAAEGRLPNFGRILDAGASMHLATLRPTQPGPVWTAVATGKLPPRNGIRSAATYWPIGGTNRIELLPDNCFSHALVRFGFLHQQVHNSADLRARPLWSILNSQGIPAGVVNWPVTHPATTVHGFLVTDRFQRLRESTVDPENAGVIWPRDALGPAMAVAGARPMTVPLVEPSAAGTRRAGRAARGPAVPGRPRPRAGVCRTAIASTRCACPRSATSASTRRATTSCGTRCRGRSATCRTRSGGGTAACSAPTTRRPTRRSAARWRRCGRTTCCSWCRHSGWSRSAWASGCWSAPSATRS